MSGIVLAVILGIAVAVALASALIAYRDIFEPIPAKKTPSRPAAEYVTRDELEAAVDEAIERATKDITFEWNEMYEKFEKLHLRLAKRDKRSKEAGAAQSDPQFDLDSRAAQAQRRSALPFRRLGSV